MYLSISDLKGVSKILYIITELERSNNSWTRNIINSVKREFSRRKIEFTEESDIDRALEQCHVPGDVILIPTPATSLVIPLVEKCNKKGIQVIAPNIFQDVGNLHRLHCVRGDIFGVMASLIFGFKQNGNNDIVLYGVNSNSQDDLLLAEAFNTSYCGRYIGIYFNDGDTQKCFDDFYENRQNVNAVICANDYIAIDLIERLTRVNPDFLNSIIIASFSNTLLSRYYNKPFTSIATNTVTVGRAIADIYKIVKKVNAQSYHSITFYVDYEIHERGNGVGIFSKNNSSSSSRKLYPFPRSFDFSIAYDNDEMISKLLRVEMGLNELSGQQLEILDRILRNFSNDEISEEMYLSCETVKYHIKKILEIFNCENRLGLKKLIGGMLSIDESRSTDKKM